MAELTKSPARERRILPRENVNLSANPVQVGVPQHGETPSPSLRVVREGAQISKIEVTCSCGCKMRILCDYQPQ